MTYYIIAFQLMINWYGNGIYILFALLLLAVG